MTKSLVVTARQAQALFKAAQRERGIVEIDPKSGVVTLIPEVYAATRTKVAHRSGPGVNAAANEKDGLTTEEWEGGDGARQSISPACRAEDKCHFVILSNKENRTQGTRREGSC